MAVLLGAVRASEFDAKASSEKPRVVVVGTGFAGLELSKQNIFFGYFIYIILSFSEKYS